MIPGGSCVIPRMRTGVRMSDANQKQQPMKMMATMPCRMLERMARQHFPAQDLAISPRWSFIVQLCIALNSFIK